MGHIMNWFYDSYTPSGPVYATFNGQPLGWITEFHLADQRERRRGVRLLHQVFGEPSPKRSAISLRHNRDARLLTHALHSDTSRRRVAETTK